MRSIRSILHVAFHLSLLYISLDQFGRQVFGFSPRQPSSRSEHRAFGLLAKPQRLAENVEGVVYVNDRCINCAACSGFAPEVFERVDHAHIVYKQPTNTDEIAKTRAALAACPVAAIRIETLAERRHGADTPTAKAAVEQAWSEMDEWTLERMSPKKASATKDGEDPSARLNIAPFPRPFLRNELAVVDVAIPDVYWAGHHNEASFGAVPYLLQVRHNNKPTWVMVDTPKYSTAAVQDILSVTGADHEPEYLFLTHVDDTADHGKWADRFKGLKQIFHAGDLGRHNWIGDKSLENVEVLLSSDGKSGNGNSPKAYTLDGTVLDEGWQEPFERGELASDAVILHTPGHSPGSITLYVRRTAGDRPGILFTGDTYAYTTSGGGRMTGFGRYGNNKKQQVETLQRLLELQAWDVIAPGHGHSRDYRGEDHSVKAMELKVAQDDLLRLSR